MIKKNAKDPKGQFSILFIGTQMAIGGAQRGLLDQARWFKSQGCKVAVAFFYDKESLHEKWSQTVDFPIYDLQAYKYEAGVVRQIALFLRRDRKSTRLNSSHIQKSRMPSSA